MKTSTNLNRNPLAPTMAALLLVCAAGVAALYQGSMGFSVVSTEDARRLAVSRVPVDTPNVAVHMPQSAALAQALRQDGRVAIVSFVYSSCNAVCSALGGTYQQLQARIRARGLERRLRLLSISFDPRDTPAVLADYARRQHADPAVWQMVGIDRDDERRQLLARFGVVVLPAPVGEFQHNAAFHLIDGQGRLVAISDYEQPEQALALATELAARQAAGPYAGLAEVRP